jgi:hypothetical protein
MSVVIPRFEHTAVVRAAEAEVVGAPNVKVRLLADSSATEGALSTVHVSLEKGADGARPHRHEKSAEPPQTLSDVQEIYDNYFLNSPEWEAARKR